MANKKHKANYVPFITTVIVLVVLLVALCVGIASCAVKAANGGTTATTAKATAKSETTPGTTVSTTVATTTAKPTTTAERTTAKQTPAKTTAKTQSNGGSSNNSSGGSSGSSSNSIKSALNNYLKKFKSVPSSGSVTKSANDVTIGQQILVNNDHAYNDSQSKDLINMMSVSNRRYLVSYDDLDADRYTLQQFNYMNTGFYNKYNYKLAACSGYRSVASQKRKFENSVASVGEKETLKWYTRPGHSEHHTGYSIDYTTNAFGSSRFTGTGKEAWITNNCHKYGFILRYPASKESITGVRHEAWHFRQVDIPHADYIMKNDLCLEEYTKTVKSYSKESPLCVKADAGGTYYIWYVKKSGSSTKIDLSGYSKYIVSGNNVDGFVVTATK